MGGQNVCVYHQVMVAFFHGVKLKIPVQLEHSEYSFVAFVLKRIKRIGKLVSFNSAFVLKLSFYVRSARELLPL